MCFCFTKTFWPGDLPRTPVRHPCGPERPPRHGPSRATRTSPPRPICPVSSAAASRASAGLPRRAVAAFKPRGGASTFDSDGPSRVLAIYVFRQPRPPQSDLANPAPEYPRVHNVVVVGHSSHSLGTLFLERMDQCDNLLLFLPSKLPEQLAHQGARDNISDHVATCPLVALPRTQGQPLWPPSVKRVGCHETSCSTREVTPPWQEVRYEQLHAEGSQHPAKRQASRDHQTSRCWLPVHGPGSSWGQFPISRDALSVSAARPEYEPPDPARTPHPLLRRHS